MSSYSIPHRVLTVCSALFLAIYVPLEIWASRNDLLSPGFICDAIAFVLLGFGIWAACCHTTRTLAPLAAAWGFCFALFWRCYFMRVAARKMDWPIYADDHPLAEPLLTIALPIAFLAMMTCIILSLRRQNSNQAVERENTL